MPITSNLSELSKTFLIPREQEAEYAKANNIIFERFESNQKIIGIHKLSSEDIYSSVNLHFSVGHYADPENKRGLHHYAEHILVSRSCYDFARKNLAGLNASTGVDFLKIVSQALFNPDYRNIGLIPLLDEIFSNLLEDKNIETIFQAEGKVLEDEYKLLVGNFGAQVNREWNKIIFAANNPVQWNSENYIEDIPNITPEDIKAVIKNELIQNNATVSFVGEGNQNQAQLIYEYLKPKLAQLGKGNAKSLDLNSFDLVNPNPVLSWQRIPLNIKNNICNISIIWLLDHQIDTPEASYSGFLASFINGQLYKESRVQGFAYDCQFVTQRSSPNKRLFQAYLTSSPDQLDQKVQKFTEMLADILSFKPETIAELNEYIEQSRIQAKIMPDNGTQMLNYQLENLQYYDLLCDYQKQKQFNLSMTLEQILSVAKDFNLDTAYKIIVGDIES